MTTLLRMSRGSLGWGGRSPPHNPFSETPNPFSETPKGFVGMGGGEAPPTTPGHRGGGWGWGCFAWGPLPPRKAPHSALLALQAMQPPVRPVRPGRPRPHTPDKTLNPCVACEAYKARPHRCPWGGPSPPEAFRRRVRSPVERV